MRKKKVEVAEYVNGEYVFTKKKKSKKGVVSALTGVGATVTFPMMALGATEEVNKTFANVHNAVLNAVDSGVVLVIIFAGASWMMGHRSRAIEILIGVACGYLIISHAMNLRDFLKSI